MISKKVGELQIKSGISSQSSKHVKPLWDRDKWKSHSNFFGLGIDVGGGSSWGAKDYSLYSKVARDFYKPKNMFAAYEAGGMYDITPDISMENAHEDIKVTKNIRPSGAMENLKIAQDFKKQMVESVQQQIRLKKEDLQKEVDKGSMNNPNEKRDEEKIKLKQQELKDLEKELKTVKDEPLSGYWTGSEVFSNYFNRLRSSQTINGIDNFR